LTLLLVYGVSAADPTCSHGKLSIDEPSCCCAAKCRRCGGSGCGPVNECCCGDIAKNDHSCATFNAPCTIHHAPTPAPLPPVPATKVNPKRGFVADGAQSCDEPLLLNTSGWYYGYNVQDPYRKPGLSGNCAKSNETDQSRFTPMDWCLSSLKTPIPSYVPTGEGSLFMGFNEPNNLHNCHTSAEAVATAWGTVMTNWPHSQLVSPATAGNGVQWYDDFFSNCTKMYGKQGCRISFLATHCYSCTPSSTLSYLKTLNERYGYPVWLTEFSCGDHAQGRPREDHIKFMRDVLPLLDAAPFVHRYSWMSAKDTSNKRGLLETVSTSDGGTKVRLTDLGKIWNS